MRHALHLLQFSAIISILASASLRSNATEQPEASHTAIVQENTTALAGMDYELPDLQQWATKAHALLNELFRDGYQVSRIEETSENEYHRFHIHWAKGQQHVITLRLSAIRDSFDKVHVYQCHVRGKMTTGDGLATDISFSIHAINAVSAAETFFATVEKTDGDVPEYTICIPPAYDAVIGLNDNRYWTSILLTSPELSKEIGATAKMFSSSSAFARECQQQLRQAEEEEWVQTGDLQLFGHKSNAALPDANARKFVIVSHRALDPTAKEKFPSRETIALSDEETKKLRDDVRRQLQQQRTSASQHYAEAFEAIKRTLPIARLATLID